MRLRSASVVAAGASSWRLVLEMDDDNGDASLPTSFRRWWHCRISNLGAGNATHLDVRIDNTGYSDAILPVWSLSTDGGVSYTPYERCPVTAVPVTVGGQERFQLSVPSGVTDVRLAKFYPYTIAEKDAYLQSVSGHPSGHVRSIRSIAVSRQGRAIQMLELTDSTVPDVGKHRVWIHSGIHPAETTSYFMVEGLIDYLLSGDGLAEALMDRLIVNVVPMANPDGVFLGNYRTNVASVNLENEWGAPYASSEPEIQGLRSKVEEFMGTVGAPGQNPIEVLLNLHSSHNVAYPFHFQHLANASWSPGASGVLPSVHALEARWIQAARAASPVIAAGPTLSSSCGAPARPFVECMVHDRWSAQAGWTGEPVMAITLEGTYGLGPDQQAWSTDDDYRRVGGELAVALADYFGIRFGATIAPFGAPCPAVLSGTTQVVGSSLTANLQISGAAPTPFGYLVLGVQPLVLVLPLSPACFGYLDPIATIGFGVPATGSVTVPINLPPVSGLQGFAQGIFLDVPASSVTSTNGLQIATTF